MCCMYTVNITWQLESIVRMIIFHMCVIIMFAFSRCAHHFRWALRRAITASLWTSPDPGDRRPWQEAWTQLAWVLAWTAPISAALQWAWTSPGHQEWGRLGPMAKGCPSKDTQAPDLSPCQCRAQRGPILEKWGYISSQYIIYYFHLNYYQYYQCTYW